MIQLHNELITLGKCVKYQNLSQAAAHVGLSQPQLSRVISKLETELDVNLLDRSARKKSAWTPIAFKIAETFSHNVDKLQNELQNVLETTNLKHLNVGILEGLIPFATQFINKLFEQAAISSVDVRVHDLSELELGFSKGDFDILLTIREPSRRKVSNLLKIGYQTLDRVERGREFEVYSSFEFSTLSPKIRKQMKSKSVVSNSLLFREAWLKTNGGVGQLPSPIQSVRPSRPGVETVYLIGSEQVSTKLWTQVKTASKSI